MEKSKYFFLLSSLTFCSLLFSQVETPELISFKNQNLIKTIESILLTKNDCNSSDSNYSWYIEHFEDDTFVVSASRVGNLLQSLEDKKMYATIINNNVVFYVTASKCENFLKLGFSIDLSNYKNHDYVFFEDYSYWVIAKSESNNYIIKDESVFNCKD